jgi:carboxymethylenebutenolidase
VTRGVVVVQEALGVTPWLEGVAARFAAEGYATAVPHLYRRLGDPVLEHPQDFPKAREAMATLTAESILEDVDAAIEATGVPHARVAVVGFCMGGNVALFAGAMRELGAAVSFYGGGITESRWAGVPPLVEVAPGLRSPWLGLYGLRDTGIPVEHVDALEAAARLAPVPTRVERYDAGHGFFNDSLPDLHAPAAAGAAWPLVLSWLRQNLPE